MLRSGLGFALGSLTTRGRCFVAAGAVVAASGAALGQPDLLRIGALLIVVPVLSAFGAVRAERRLARYRLTCTRQAEPARLRPGQRAWVTLRLSGAPRPGAGLLLAEDTLPAQFGPPPRFVLDRPRGGALRYQVRASARGKYPVGPLRVRVADPFGLVAITRPVGPAVTLTVTPRIVPLPGPPPGGTWPGDAHGRRGAAGDGEDDIAPRPYQVGDGLSRVHWRSTARYGELMVRREERRWRDTSALFLDTRRAAFGSDALFELAVTAAASIAVVLARRETGARLVTDSGDVASFGDTLLDTLAVIRPSRSAGLGAGAAELRSRGGPVIAVLGALTARQARQVAEAKAGASSAFALLVGKTTGPTGEATGLAGGTAGLGGETAGLGGKPAGSPAAGILAAAGWRVASVADEVSLAAAWRELRSREFADG